MKYDPHLYAQYQSRKAANRAAIANGITQGIQNFADEYKMQQEKKSDEEVLQKMNNPELSQMERANLALKLSANGQKSLMTIMDLHYKLQHQQELQRRHDEEQALRQQREGRLGEQHETKSIQSMYLNKIREIEDELKDVYSKSDRQPLKEQKKALQQELGKNLNRLRQGKQPEFKYLQIEEEPMPVQQQPVEGMNQMGAKPMQQNPTAPVQRARWNPQDPTHQARALEILQAAKGDRALANQQLAQEFER